MILITGATGTIGSEVVRLLAERGAPVRSMTRDVSRASGPAVQADFEDPASLRRALDGVESVLLLTAFGTRLGEHDVALVEAAAAAGVRKVVKISAIGAGETGDPADVRSWHAVGERALMASGLAWTLLRPSTFASNALGWADLVKSGAPIPNMTGEGRQGIVDPRDVAAVAVEALAGREHDGQAHTLTGPDLLTTADQAALIGKAADRHVDTVDVPVEAAVAQLVESGAGPAFVRAATAGWNLISAGGNAIVTTAVADILGRPATSFEAWALTNRAAFA